MFISKNTLNKTTSLEPDKYPEIKLETSLFLHGKTGSGKTYKAKQLALEFFTNYPETNGEFITFLDLIQTYKNSFKEGLEATEYRKQIKDYKECFLLILDDLGTEKATEFINQTLFEIINFRVENSLPVIITSNLSLEDLSDKYEQKIIRRLKDICEVHYFDKKIQPAKPKIQIRFDENVEIQEPKQEKISKDRLWEAFNQGYLSTTTKKGLELEQRLEGLKTKLKLV